ncbi:MAG: hypothetical protein ACKV2Q_01425 [Planctomycetaceae bacterium]
MSRNLMHDHRVTPTREAAFDRFVVQRPVTTAVLQQAIVDYFHAKVRDRKRPDYVYAAVNDANLLTGTATGRHSINKDVQLVRVLDLNGLGQVFTWAKLRKEKWFTSFPDSYDERMVATWLDARMQGRPILRVDAFVGAILAAMNAYRRVKPYQPTWATTHEAFATHVAEGPDRWLEVLGMTRPTSPRWLILLKYPIREAGTLCRPTQLDAGWYAYHFPSPPQTPLEVGGHAMDLRTSPSAASLLPEFIHSQIDHELRHKINIGRTTRVNAGALADQRQYHHQLLAAEYGPGVYTWMSNPV